MSPFSHWCQSWTRWTSTWAKAKAPEKPKPGSQTFPCKECRQVDRSIELASKHWVDVWLKRSVQSIVSMVACSSVKYSSEAGHHVSIYLLMIFSVYSWYCWGAAPWLRYKSCCCPYTVEIFVGPILELNLTQFNLVWIQLYHLLFTSTFTVDFNFNLNVNLNCSLNLDLNFNVDLM